jgi:tRNA G10  N-methylase Trm11
MPARDLLRTLHDEGHPARYIYTDPPYGIDMDNLRQQQGGMAIDQVRHTHDVDENKKELGLFIEAAFKYSADYSWLVFWLDQDLWHYCYTTATSCGWRVQRWPFVWCKTDTCANQAADYNITKATEIAMFCAKPSATLSTINTYNWTNASNDKKQYNVTNPFWKPTAVHRIIIKTIAPKGTTVVDPYCGCGSIPLTCVQTGNGVVCGDIDKMHLGKLYSILGITK